MPARIRCPLASLQEHQDVQGLVGGRGGRQVGERVRVGEHAGSEYILRTTRNGKLILTK